MLMHLVSKYAVGYKGAEKPTLTSQLFETNTEDDLGHSLEVEMEPGADEDEFSGMDESINCAGTNSTETQTMGDDFTEVS